MAFEGEIVGERVWDGIRTPVIRFEFVTPLNGDTGAIDAMTMWAGESVGGVLGIQPAAEIVRELAAEAERLVK